jgi:hypothetical protein
MVRRQILNAIGILLCAYLVGCGNGNSGSNNNGSTSSQILARNVLLSSAHASLADKNAIKKEIDTTTTVSADNVVIDTAGNSLNSTNLQDALDKEMAINLSKVLPGTTWTITNKTVDRWYKGKTGRVTFSNTTLNLDQGVFAAAGLVDDYTVLGCPPISSISYEVFSNSIMYLNWTAACTTIEEADHIVTIFARDRNTLSMIGSGGAGDGRTKISILTKVQ